MNKFEKEIRETLTEYVLPIISDVRKYLYKTYFSFIMKDNSKKMLHIGFVVEVRPTFNDKSKAVQVEKLINSLAEKFLKYYEHGYFESEQVKETIWVGVSGRQYATDYEVSNGTIYFSPDDEWKEVEQLLTTIKTVERTLYFFDNTKPIEFFKSTTPEIKQDLEKQFDYLKII